MKVPSTPGNSRTSIARQQASNGAFTMRAPRLRMRSSLVSAAVSIATTVHAIPASRAAYATPCPALPALMVQTPFLRASGDSIATAFAAPRILKALIGCRFSSFSQISGAGESWRSLTSGVRMARFLMRWRAARISSRLTGRTGGGARGMARAILSRARLMLSSASMEVNVGNPERWVSVVAGSALAAYGLTRRSIPGLVVAALGGAIAWRGATGRCPLYQTLGISTAGNADQEERHVSVPYGRGIGVEESVIVNVSPEEVYRFWRNFENLPRFMSHLKSVRVIDDKRSHWIARGPAGTDAQWDAEIINEIPNELIGWRSVDGANVRNAGSVHFTPANGKGTEVKVELRYDPPAGVIGATIAKILGKDPAREVQEDLRALKELIETR